LKSIAFIDTEIGPQDGKILDIGIVKDDGSIFHKASGADSIEFIKGALLFIGLEKMPGKNFALFCLNYTLKKY